MSASIHPKSNSTLIIYISHNPALVLYYGFLDFRFVGGGRGLVSGSSVVFSMWKEVTDSWVFSFLLVSPAL